MQIEKSQYESKVVFSTRLKRKYIAALRYIAQKEDKSMTAVFKAFIRNHPASPQTFDEIPPEYFLNKGEKEEDLWNHTDPHINSLLLQRGTHISQQKPDLSEKP